MKKVYEFTHQEEFTHDYIPISKKVHLLKYCLLLDTGSFVAYLETQNF